MSIGHNSGERAELKSTTSQALESVVNATIETAKVYLAAALAITSELGPDWTSYTFHPSNKRKSGDWRKTAKLARFHAIVDELYDIAKAKGYSNPSMILRQLREIAKAEADKAKAAEAKAKLEAKLDKMSPAKRAKAEADIKAAEAAAKAKPTKAQRHDAAIKRKVVELVAAVDGAKGNKVEVMLSYALLPFVTPQGEKYVFNDKLDVAATLDEMITNLQVLKDSGARK